MRTPQRSLATCGLFAACALAAGCGSDPVAELLDLPIADVEGSWSYEVTNGDEATFVNCSGDATVLEGESFDAAQAMAPICHITGPVAVTQDLAALVVLPGSVTCSDGSNAVLSGLGFVTEDAVDGQWDSASEDNVLASQAFEGSVAGTTITLSEDHRDFSGNFQGSCDLEPALTASVSVQ